MLNPSEVQLRLVKQARWRQVRPDLTACLEWTGHNVRGYGRMSVNGVQVGTHRLSWIIKNGPIPPGMMVCHHCDNPPCFRISHLFLGDSGTNQRDRQRKKIYDNYWGAP